MNESIDSNRCSDSAEIACTDPSKRIRIASALILFALIGLAILLRVERLDTSFQGDEILTWKGASLDFGQTIFYRPYPLYYMLAHFFLLFGESEVALRMPSALAGILSVPAIYFLAREVAGRKAGLAAAFLIAVNTYNIHYSGNARYYALVMLAEIVLALTLYRAVVRGGPWNWTGFVLTALWALVVQLTVVPFFGAMLIGASCWILFSRSIPGLRQKMRRMAVLGACSVLGMGALGITVAATGFPSMLQIDDATGQEDATDSDADVDPRGNTYDYVMTPALYWQYLREFLPVVPAGVQWALVVFMLSGFLALCRHASAMAWIVFAQFVIVPLPFFVTSASHWYNDKYFCSLVPLYAFLAAVGCAHVAKGVARVIVHPRVEAVESEQPSRRRYRRIVETGVVGILLLAYCPFAASEVALKLRGMEPVDWKHLARHVAENLEPGDVIAFAREARARSRDKPIEEREYNRSHPAFQYYLESYLRKRFPESSIEVLESVRRTAVATPDALTQVLHRFRRQRIWIVSIHEKKIDSGVHEYLDRIPVAETTSYKGGRIRLVLPR